MLRGILFGTAESKSVWIKWYWGGSHEIYMTWWFEAQRHSGIKFTERFGRGSSTSPLVQEKKPKIPFPTGYPEELSTV